MIEHRHVIFVLAVVKVAKRDVTAVRSLSESISRLRLVRTSGIPVQFRTGIKVPNSLRNLSIQQNLTDVDQ